jgi:hypothetical protein
MGLQRLFFLLLITVLIGCGESSRKNATQAAIVALTYTYPELSKNLKDYELVRSVGVDKRSFELKLFTCKTNSNETHSIVVLSNANGETHAIPLFSNNKRKYWNFENEPRTFNEPKYNSLFEKEFMRGINQLKINDSLGTGYAVLFEIFQSALHFEKVNELDEEYLKKIGYNFISSNAHADNYLDCEKRNKINCEQLFDAMFKDEYVIHYNAYLDSKNQRVFQFEYPKSTKRKIKQLHLKIYRFGCESQLLSL